MKKKMLNLISAAVLISGSIIPVNVYSQVEEAFAEKYFASLPAIKTENFQRSYRMTTIHINRDLHGAFQSKTRVTGDYTRGFSDGHMTWNNVFIAHTDSLEKHFSEGTRQEYIENFSYKPSDNMLSAEAFINFPAHPDNVLARNLIWDMMTFETFAWMFWDSLDLNIPYVIRDTGGEFAMAEIGTYKHNVMIICWKGITTIDGQLCAVIDFNAIDNLISLEMDFIKAKGTEQYWGTIWVSIKTRNIEKALMYGGVMLDNEIRGLPQNYLVKTVRELSVEPIK
ncbi:MAG: hypothetical protein RBT38_01955 [Bacteroidales bacterium]|jgi:hypothetical protein|nr:hypothetical protein [Bacteroidales bacterium]